MEVESYYCGADEVWCFVWKVWVVHGCEWGGKCLVLMAAEGYTVKGVYGLLKGFRVVVWV